MNDIKVLRQLEEKFNEMTPSFKKIANYILINYKYIPAVSSSDLADKIGVSDASIIRFSQHLGYKGFIDFKNVLLKQINGLGKNPADKMLRTIENIGESDEDYAKIFENELINLNRTIVNFSSDNLKKSVDEIEKAARVIIIGMGTSRPIADLLKSNLRRIGLNCETIEYGGIYLFDELYKIREDDVIIMISFPRYSVDSYEAMKYVNKLKSKSIIFTDNTENKLAKLSDYVLVATSENPIYFFNSYVGPIALCNILVYEYFKRNKVRCLKFLESAKKLDNYYL